MFPVWAAVAVSCGGRLSSPLPPPLQALEMPSRTPPARSPLLLTTTKPLSQSHNSADYIDTPRVRTRTRLRAHPHAFPSRKPFVQTSRQTQRCCRRKEKPPTRHPDLFLTTPLGRTRACVVLMSAKKGKLLITHTKIEREMGRERKRERDDGGRRGRCRRCRRRCSCALAAWPQNKNQNHKLEEKLRHARARERWGMKKRGNERE